jgi:hypothetical protein
MIRTRTAAFRLILAVSSLNGVSVACSALCSMYGPGHTCAACLTELQACGARGDLACCDGLQCVCWSMPDALREQVGKGVLPDRGARGTWQGTVRQRQA